MRGHAPLMSRKSDNWATPRAFFQACTEKFGYFDVDAAATLDNRVVAGFIGPERNALTVPWGSGAPFTRVWCNPPYSQIAQFVDKALVEARSCEIVLLVPARTDTQWWHRLTAKGDAYLLKGRLKFGDGEGTAPFPSAVVVLGRRSHGRIVNWDWRVCFNCAGAPDLACIVCDGTGLRRHA